MNDSSQRLSKHAMGMIGLLVVEYILGMGANAYIQLPADASKTLGLANGQWAVWAHIILGTLIVVGSIALYVRAVKARNELWKIAGSVTSISVVLAWGFGDEFFMTQAAASSFAMSLCFIVALVTLGWGCIYSERA